MFVLPLRYIDYTCQQVFTRAMVHQSLHIVRKKLNCRNVWNISILLFPYHMQNLIVYHCPHKHSLSFIAKYTQELAWTLFILTAVTQGHTNLILHNLHKRWTIHYCFDSCTISGLPLHAMWNASVFICLLLE